MKVIDFYNLAVGAVVAVLSAIFGTYWYLFAGFLACNILDWVTGWYRSRKLRQESSYSGLKGILKKVGYWVIVAVGFMIPHLFVRFGHDALGVNLDFLSLFGWFTLATLLIDELRSILENLVEAGYDVPEFLVSGLAITEKLVNAKTEIHKKEAEHEDQ